MKATLATTILGGIAIFILALFLLGNQDEADALGNGVILGAYAQPIEGRTNREAIEKLEDSMGTTLPMVRAYSSWDDPVGEDKPLHRWIRDGDRDLMLSVKPQRKDGSFVTWTQVADAEPGSRVYAEIEALASGLRRYEQPIIFGFHHEPELAFNQKFGSSADFRRAYRKVRTVFEAEGVTNAHFAWIMTEWSFAVDEFDPTDRRRADFWYPGDDVVDLIAADTYNWDDCRGNDNDPWTSLQDDLEPVLRFSEKHPSKPLILAELGSDEGSAGAKAEWIEDAQALFKTAPYKNKFAAILYFHDDGREEGWRECTWWLDSSASSTQAARGWFQDDFYRADLQTPAVRPGLPIIAKPTTTTTTTRPPAVVTEHCNNIPATIVGTSGDDQLRGTDGRDVIVGRAGNDTITGLGGDDIICGGEGNDTISGGGGSDILFGGGGRDLLRGGYGPDVIHGGLGADRINGQHGNDELFGNEGNDVMRGGPHQDLVRGGANADTMLGQGGFDVLTGGPGNDTINGGVGADKIVGGGGADRCNGGPGPDSNDCERATS